MMSHLLLLCTIVASTQLLGIAHAGEGYFYERPTPASNTGHRFSPLPTIVPLPAVPALPALPTPRSYVQTQTLLQEHPPAAPKSIAAAYLPPRAPQTSYLPPSAAAKPQQPAVSQITQLYRPPQAQQQQQQQQQLQPGIDLRFGSAAPPTASGTFTASAGTPGGPFAPSATFTRSPPPQPPQVRLTAPSAPSAPSAPGGIPLAQYTPTLTQSQPLRIPFGKTAVYLPGNEQTGNAFYTSNDGRQLKQYAVVEVIDNDIEQMTVQPFLAGNNFFDSYRAHFGATGTGAAPGSIAGGGGGGVQLSSRANIAVQQQQLPQQLSGATALGDSIALGSGGLGYIRLPNGNVYLGSGSLGYISGQQRLQSVRDLRARAGATQPDALHFGNGSFGGSVRRYK